MNYTNVVWYQLFLWLFYSFYMPESTTLFIFSFYLPYFLAKKWRNKNVLLIYLEYFYLYPQTTPITWVKRVDFCDRNTFTANNFKLLEFWIIRKELELSSNLLSTGNSRSFREQIQLTAVMLYTHYKRMKTWMNDHNSNCRLSIGTSCRIFWLTILF